MREMAETACPTIDVVQKIGECDERYPPLEAALELLCGTPAVRQNELTEDDVVLLEELADDLGVPSADARITTLGRFRVSVGGREVPDEAWRRQKARQLLKYLLGRPHRRALKEEAIEVFWPESDPGSASTNLRTTVYALRRAVGAVGNQLVLEDHASYSLAAQGALWVDADAFIATLERAATAADPLALLEYADGLYAGEYLPDDQYEDWAADRRQHLKRMWRELQFALVRLGDARAEPARSIAALERLLRTDSCDELAAQELMQRLNQIGQRGAALRVYQRLIQALKEDLGVEPSGQIGELYRKISTDTEPRDIRTRGAAASLPISPTPLIGRESEFEAIGARLEDHRVRLLTLVGPGGVGKTRLALAAAENWQAGFADGACFVDLSPVRDAALALSSVARALGLHQPGPGTSMERVLHAHLCERQMLLVLDNCEQVLDLAQAIAHLVAECTQITVLCTSRQPLRSRWEYLFEVFPLEVPDPNRLPPLAQLARTPAVALLLEHSRKAGAALPLSEQNAHAVAQLCARLDGLPLALELAAVRMRALPPAALLEHLDGGPGGFRGLRDAPVRHRSLSKAIHWSYQLLSDAEQRVFQRLSVFRAGWGLEACKVVCAGDAVQANDVVDHIEQLVDKSLVVSAQSAGEPPRYRMLETLRDFAWERLLESGGVEVTSAQHCEYFTNILEQRLDRFNHDFQNASLVYELEVERNNFLAAMRWCIDGGDVERGLRLGGVLASFLYFSGSPTEGQECLDAVQRLLLLSNSRTLIRARALTSAGILADMIGDHTRAEALHEQSLAIRRELGTPVGGALNALARAAWRRGDYDRAHELFTDSIAIARAESDRLAVAVRLRHLGQLFEEQGRYTAAREAYSASLEVCQEIGYRAGMSEAIEGLGQVALEEGDIVTANTLCEANLALAREIDNPMRIAWSCLDLGLVRLQQERWDEARTLFEQSLEVGRILQDQRRIPRTLAGLAWAHARIGDAERAFRLFGAATALRDAAGRPPRAWAAPPFDSDSVQRWEPSARTLLGEQRAADAFARGYALTMDQAIAEAR
jgi:predicted ATPase/DNA-binding SARP family transcriptional activator